MSETAAASPASHRIPRQAWWFLASITVAVLLWGVGITLAIDAPPPPPRGLPGPPLPPPPGPHPAGALLVILSGLAAAATVASVLFGLAYRHEAQAQERHDEVLAQIGEVAAKSLVLAKRAAAGLDSSDDIEAPIGLDPEVLGLTRRLNRRLNGLNSNDSGGWSIDTAKAHHDD